VKTFTMTFSILTVLAAWVVQAGAQVCPPPGCTLSCQADLNAYEVKEAVQGSATVCTNFACGDIQVKRTIRLLTPSAEVQPPAVTPHYLGYELQSETYDESQNPGVKTFVTAHNNTTQDTRMQTVLLLVPAGKSIPSRGEPPPSLPATSDGFLCFKPSSRALGTGQITNTDQFSTQQFVIHRVAYTCLSAGINAPPPSLNTWLLGVAAKDATFRFPPPAAIIDIFHPSGKEIELKPIDELVSIATVTP
jgi:hypothetical protein